MFTEERPVKKEKKLVEEIQGDNNISEANERENLKREQM